MVLKVRLFPYPRYYPDCGQTPAGAVVALLETQTSASLGSVWLQQSLNRGKPGIEFICQTARPLGPPVQVAVFQQLCELPIRADGLHAWVHGFERAHRNNYRVYRGGPPG